MADKTSILRGPKASKSKVRVWGRGQTTGTAVATLIKGSRLLGFVLGGTPSNAVTTATLSIGNTLANANEYVNAADVKTAALGAGPTLLPMVAGTFGSVLQVDTPIYFKYAETGGASSAGGGFVEIRFNDGNIVDDDTV